MLRRTSPSPVCREYLLYLCLSQPCAEWLRQTPSDRPPFHLTNGVKFQNLYKMMVLPLPARGSCPDECDDETNQTAKIKLWKRPHSFFFSVFLKRVTRRTERHKVLSR